MFNPLANELRALGARDGARSPVTVHSPVGPLQLFVEIDLDELRIFFARDSNEAAAEAAFGQLMAQLVSLGGDRVLCASGQASFLEGKKLLAVAPLDDETRTLLVEHGRTLVPEGESSGSSVLLSDTGAPRTLRVALSESGVAFSLGS